MNRNIEAELNKLLSSVDASIKDSLLLEFRYPLSFSGFQGHFPGNPILPGICMLQSLRIGLQRVLERPLRMTRISRARFSTPIRPDDHVFFHAQIIEQNDFAIGVKATVKRDATRIADFALTLATVNRSEAAL